MRAWLVILLLVPSAGAATVPQLDLDFEKPDRCGSREYADCLPILGDNRTLELDGQFRWLEHVDLMLTWQPSGEAIPVTFAQAASAAAWLTLETNPTSVEVEPSRYGEPEPYPPSTEPSFTIGAYEVVHDITVTITRTGMPDTASLDQMLARNGTIAIFLKAASAADSQGAYRNAFGIEEFRFNAFADAQILELATARAKVLAEQGNTTGLGFLGLLGVTGAEPTGDEPDEAAAEPVHAGTSAAWIIAPLLIVGIAAAAAAFDIYRRKRA